ncbi:hypothetical protein EVAR_28623_1 [Eumeta japonica]|uniref:Uncharacterized protein n=1 Tax=Eumeta variegata TaxID=151549 RepID=A0A4C1XS30_EUMVA|nr:hypothetical protein EVAR_28623_1 [Eumeta japonica]
MKYFLILTLVLIAVEIESKRFTRCKLAVELMKTHYIDKTFLGSSFDRGYHLANVATVATSFLSTDDADNQDSDYGSALDCDPDAGFNYDLVSILKLQSRS